MQERTLIHMPSVTLLDLLHSTYHRGIGSRASKRNAAQTASIVVNRGNTSQSKNNLQFALCICGRGQCCGYCSAATFIKDKQCVSRISTAESHFCLAQLCAVEVADINLWHQDNRVAILDKMPRRTVNNSQLRRVLAGSGT